MEYCSIDDAFPATGLLGSSPGASTGTKTKRKKPKSGMTAAPPEPVSLETDPDRQQYTKKQVPEAEHSNSIEQFATIQAAGSVSQRFFGHGDDDDDFAPYTGPMPKDEFLLQTDFKNTFAEKGFGKAAGLSLEKGPVQFDTQFQKSLFLEPVSTRQVPTPTTSTAPDITKQLDKLQARLDDLERFRRGNEENSQAEITLFVMSGLAFLFVMDLVARI